MNVLDSSIQRGLFSKEEDNKLMDICQQYEGGCGCDGGCGCEGGCGCDSWCSGEGGCGCDGRCGGEGEYGISLRVACICVG